MVQVVQQQQQRNDDRAEKTQQTLKRMKRVSEEEQASQLAARHNLPYVDLNLVPVNAEESAMLPEDVARKYAMGLFFRRGRNIRIGCLDPTNEAMRMMIQKLQEKRGWDIRLFVISQSSLEKIFFLYSQSSLIKNIDQIRLALTGEDLENFEKKFHDVMLLQERMNEMPTSDVLALIFAGAVKLGASDVHFEPQETGVRLRYRLDGILQDIGVFIPSVYKSILSRIKVLSKIKLNIRSSAQDGHFSITMNTHGGIETKEPTQEASEENKIDIRVSTIPSRHGESIVMRLLDQSDVLLSIEELGLRGLAFEEVQKQIAKPNGMVITTGPTGSGKTTTLYSLINKLNETGTKIITIEDPIEYEVKGISQTQVAAKAGYTFADGLRSIVRQDPDVILVGEIRDDETADIALNAALTGHLVLSTLHTNDASGSIPRLIELGIKPGLIPPATNVLIAQRLVRKLCKHCKQVYEPAQETTAAFKRVLSLISPRAKIGVPKEIAHLYKPVGCAKCNNLGYRGRIGIFEVLVINEEIRELIEDMHGASDIMQAAMRAGMITMAQDGILKAVEGITSMEEVLRVAGQVDFLEEIYQNLMEQSLGRSLHISEEFTSRIIQEGNTKNNFIELLKKVQPENIAEMIFSAANFFGTGDIHLEPEHDHVNIRFRVDGILQNMGSLPPEEYVGLLGRIKMLSGMKTDERQGAADGRFSIVFSDKYTENKVDVRVSIILSGYGETVVLRLLNQSSVSLDIHALGIREQNLQKIQREVRKPNGIFLNTGPTGSGKTTTLYSLLKTIHSSDMKIMTVEDPIEYQLDGITQTQVNEKEGYTFTTALRSLLRQNPDVMMIGEIRDEETANIAIQSALTGHLVLSTLHTNDAVSSLQRLINMNIRNDDLAMASNAYMAQRLIRRLCAKCRKERALTEAEEQRVDRVLQTLSPESGVSLPQKMSLFDPVGCSECHGIGYKGRTVLSEVLVIDNEIRESINNHDSIIEIAKQAVSKGMITMTHDGVLKALEGETTLEEVERAVEV